MKKKRHWTAQEKLAILQEANKEGITATIRKYGIYSNTLYDRLNPLIIGQRFYFFINIA